MLLDWTWHDDATGIADLQPEWHDLATRDPLASVYQLPAVAMGLAHAAAEPCTPLIGAARNPQGVLVGVLPMSRGRQLVGKVPVTVIRRLGVGSVDRLELLASSDEEAAVCAKAAQALAGLRRGGAILDIMPVLETSRLYRALATAPDVSPRDGLRLFSDHHQAVLEGATSWGELTNRSVRSNVSRGDRAIRRIGGSYQRATSPTEVSAWVTQFRQIHRARQRSLGRPSILDGDLNFVAFESCLRQLVGDGVARLHGLCVADEMIAGHITLHWGRTATSYRIAFDEAHALVSPGLVLLSYVIDDAIASGAGRFDFGYGNEMYKTRWIRETTPVHRVGVTPNTVRYFVGRFTRKAAWLAYGRRAAKVVPTAP